MYLPTRVVPEMPDPIKKKYLYISTKFHLSSRQRCSIVFIVRTVGLLKMVINYRLHLFIPGKCLTTHPISSGLGGENNMRGYVW